MKEHCGQKIGDKSCQSNFDTQGPQFLVLSFYLITTVLTWITLMYNVDLALGVNLAFFWDMYLYWISCFFKSFGNLENVYTTRPGPPISLFSQFATENRWAFYTKPFLWGNWGGQLCNMNTERTPPNNPLNCLFLPSAKRSFTLAN